MDISTLNAISPLDGRYWNKVEGLSTYFSEFALFNYRVKVEIEYFIALVNIPLPQLEAFDHSKENTLKTIYQDFSQKDAERIKEIEKETNHDVKAVEYFIKEKFDELKLSQFKEFIHFGLTSQDINNTSLPLLIKECISEAYEPLLDSLIKKLHQFADKWIDQPMLARTHGQPASPTTMGKEWMVFVERLNAQKELLDTIPYSAKFGGATGNFNAHVVTYPSIDWHAFADKFVASALGLKRSHYTTQIEHYDNLAALFDNLKRINSVLIDFSRDIWTYISMNYFQQTVKENEVGSSAMPHKVNPIDFENAEGNLGIANALFTHLSAKLPISRLQRDLTDSTVTRNIGVPIAHTFLAIYSLQRGLDKLVLDKEVLKKDLDDNWAVVAEAFQSILRREGYPEPFEALKNLTRKQKKITRETLEQFINELDIKEEIKKELRNITPFNYTGK